MGKNTARNNSGKVNGDIGQGVKRKDNPELWHKLHGHAVNYKGKRHDNTSGGLYGKPKVDEYYKYVAE